MLVWRRWWCWSDDDHDVSDVDDNCYDVDNYNSDCLKMMLKLFILMNIDDDYEDIVKMMMMIWCLCDDDWLC
jgi:hypothetical protein